MARTELRFHPIFLFSIVILLVVFSTLGYQVGVSRQSQGFRLLLDASMRQETHNRQRAAACQKKTQELLHTSNSSEAVLRKLIETESKLEAERDALNSEYYLLQEQYNRCDTTREKLKPIAASSGGDNTLKSQVGQLNTHIEHLRATIREFTVSDGMELVLLAESLRSLRGRYLRQCSQTPGCSMLTPAELIARGAAGTELNDSQYTFIVSQDDEADKKRPVRVGSPNEMLNISNLFLLPETVEGSVLDKEPEYFSRQGSHETPPSRSPTSTPISQNQPALDVVEKMTDYSLCAYRANNSNFSFPSCAMSVDLDGSSTAVVHAHEVFRTPMLRFCTDCNATKWTSVYRIACHGHSAVANYGVPDFWSARSMIRVSGEVNSAVRRFYDANNLKGKHVLSVVAPETTQSRQALCNASTSPGPHFLYLKSSYPSDGHITSHVSPSSVQCAPSSSEIAAQIRKVAAQTAYPFAAIYLSAQKDVWNEVAEALKATAEPALSDTIVLDPAKHLHAANSSIGSILDLETASYATDILVSGYLPTGRYVSEVYLLRRHLFPDGHVWFF